MGAHARFSPSSGRRYLSCPPSLKLEEQFADEQSPYAAEGTAGHEMAEYLIKKHLKKRTKRPVSDYYSDELMEAVEDYAAYGIEQIEMARKADIYIIGRDNVTWLVEQSLFSFDMVVIDELSSFKSPKAQRFKALKKVRPMAKRAVGLTGTPGNPMDLWAEIGILDMGRRLGRYIGGYRDRFFVPDKRNREIIYSYKPREGAEEKIYELISDISISMKAADHLKMPELVSRRVEVRMSEKEKALYDKMERDMMLQFGEGKDIDAVNAASLSNKLQQMANGAVYDESGNVQAIHDRKLDALDKAKLGEKIGKITDSILMDAITVALQVQIGVYEEYN